MLGNILYMYFEPRDFAIPDVQARQLHAPDVLFIHLSVRSFSQSHYHQCSVTEENIRGIRHDRMPSVLVPHASASHQVACMCL